MRVSDFHFDLPEQLIAQHPPAERGSSRMLVMQRDAGDGAETQLRDEIFTSLPQLLQPGDLLVLNDSRVLPARLFGRRVSARAQGASPQPSGLIEALLVEEETVADETEPATGARTWRALVKPARKLRVGDRLELFATQDAADGPTLTAEVIATGEFGERTLRFSPVEDFYGAIARIGHMPLPPYIRRDQSAAPDTPEDLTRYQTVYSKQSGSAAAPTAGLHFTPEILAALRARGVEIATLTLHVGLGTFQPVRVAELADIRLHSERYTLPAATADSLNRALHEGRRILAVGTTTTRTLEHIALQASQAETLAKTTNQASQPATGNQQPATTAFHPHSGSTSIFLSPGHRFRIVSGLLTNFHLPESTLLMLVAAFAASPPIPAEDPATPTRAHAGRAEQGRQAILAAYAHAIRKSYRFYSYGDCMLLL